MEVRHSRGLTVSWKNYNKPNKQGHIPQRVRSRATLLKSRVVAKGPSRWFICWKGSSLFRGMHGHYHCTVSLVQSAPRQNESGPYPIEGHLCYFDLLDHPLHLMMIAHPRALIISLMSHLRTRSGNFSSRSRWPTFCAGQPVCVSRSMTSPPGLWSVRTRWHRSETCLVYAIRK